VVSGFPIREYDISRGGEHAVFSTHPSVHHRRYGWHRCTRARHHNLSGSR
jgi:hypothetical protein